jgi:hypothetical protein
MKGHWPHFSTLCGSRQPISSFEKALRVNGLFGAILVPRGVVSGE